MRGETSGMFVDGLNDTQDIIRIVTATNILLLSRIFLRLFVVRLIRGFLPKSDAMKKYGYMETLGPLINAFKSGNIYEFERIHNSQRLLWASIGCFWIMKQRLSALLHRNLFRKV